MLLNGAKSDPAKSAGEPGGIARLKLTQALERATYAIAWERAWPILARLLTLAGLLPAQGGAIAVDGTRVRTGRRPGGGTR